MNSSFRESYSRENKLPLIKIVTFCFNLVRIRKKKFDRKKTFLNKQFVYDSHFSMKNNYFSFRRDNQQ